MWGDLTDLSAKSNSLRCRYEDARGDQCDNCGTLLDPTELINPKCKFSNTTPIMRETSHLYIDLPKLTDQLAEYVSTTSALVRLSRQ